MRPWTPAIAVAALGAAGLLISSHPKPADAQVVAAAPMTTADTVFLSGGVDFDTVKGTEASKPISVSFQGRQVLSADVVLKGFDVSFIDAEHPVHQEKVKFDNLQVSGENIKFDTHLLIRDNSGNIDDPYTGHVDYLVIARVK